LAQSTERAGGVVNALYLRHTSASLLIQENEDLDVLPDLEDFLAAQAPEDTSFYRQIAEGSNDMPAHIRGALTQTHLAVPVCDGDRVYLVRSVGHALVTQTRPAGSGADHKALRFRSYSRC
jgi:secondary thiamine-phosphate synthase enzyme